MLFSAQTPALVAFDLLLFLGISILLGPAYFRRANIGRWRIGISCLFIILFFLFSFVDSDWFHYEEIFQKINTYSNFHSHMEDIYVFLMKDVCPDYITFRLLVWGTAFLFFSLSAKHLDLEYEHALLFLGLLFLPIFSYARVSLALAIQIYGCIILTKTYKRHKILSYIIGALLFFASFCFHKSASIGIVIALLAMSTRSLNKNYWFYFIILFGIGIACITFLIPLVLDTKIDDAGFAQSSQQYIARQKSSYQRGIGSILYLTLERTPYYLSALLSFKIIINNKVERSIEFIAKYIIFIVLFASIFVFDFGANTSIFYTRLLRFTIIPATFILCYSFKYKLYQTLNQLIFYIGTASTVYKLLYNIYDSAVHME